MNRQTVGPSVVFSWPHEVLDLAVSLYERGLLLHYLPYSGSWLWEAITAETDLLVTLLAVRAPHHADASRGRRTRSGSECTIFCETRASPLSASRGDNRVCVLGCTTSGRSRESNPHRQAAHLGIRRGASGAGSVARAWQRPCRPTPCSSGMHLTAKRLKHSGGRKALHTPAKDPTLLLTDSDP